MSTLSKKLILALSLAAALPAFATDAAKETPAKAVDAKPAEVKNTLKDTDVVAKVTIDGKTVEITYSQLKERLKSLPPQIQGAPIEQIYAPLVQSAVDMEIIKFRAKAKGLEKDPEVQRRIADCQEAMLQKSYLDKEIATLQTDEELKKAYSEIAKVIPKVDEVSLHQAIFRTKKEATDFLAQVKKAGDFNKALEEARKTNAEIKGGKIDYTRMDELPPSLAEAVKKAAKATLVANVVEEKLGQESLFFVVRVDDKRPGQTPSFEQLKDELKAITSQKFAAQIIERDRKDVKIEKTGLDGKPMVDAVESKKEEAKPEDKKEEEKKS